MELTRQITPPTKNGHAPPPIESRKSSQSVNPYYVWTWWVFPCWVKLSRRLHSWWCPSLNSFKFQLCNHISPGTRKLWFPIRCQRDHQITLVDPQSSSFMVRTRTVSDRLRFSNFRSWLMKTFFANFFRISSSFVNPRISPLATKYECPQLSLLIITSVRETNGK